MGKWLKEAKYENVIFTSYYPSPGEPLPGLYPEMYSITTKPVRKVIVTDIIEAYIISVEDEDGKKYKVVYIPDVEGRNVFELIKKE